VDAHRVPYVPAHRDDQLAHGRILENAGRVANRESARTGGLHEHSGDELPGDQIHKVGGTKLECSSSVHGKSTGRIVPKGHPIAHPQENWPVPYVHSADGNWNRYHSRRSLTD